MYTITLLWIKWCFFFSSLFGPHVSQHHHPTSFLSKISHWSFLSPHPRSWVILQPTKNSTKLKRIIKLCEEQLNQVGLQRNGGGVGTVWGWWHKALSLSLSLSLSYFSSLPLILVPRVGLPQYPMKSLPQAHNSSLAMPMPLGTCGSLLHAIAPTALLTHLLQAFALHPTSLAALLATLVCIEARPEWKKPIVQQHPQFL
jgi:hypothetical protein